MRLFFVLLLTAVISVEAQTPQVPHKMQFAGMTLTIREDARREIQKDVNALTQSPKHHNIKVERAKTYFPIIEKVFEEERVPEDFKYLVLQESALIADAVSVSNAVGFWQFKDFTAVEMGLRVDKEIDERLNIVSSTRAAARYIKKNNFFFNNWLFALQAYQMGAGGAMKSLPKNLSGARHMEITKDTYWYVKKFLAHKVAFENDVKGAGNVKAITYENNTKRSLSDIAKEVAVSEDDIKSYNKWAKHGKIPDDRTYSVIIPVIGEATEIKIPETVLAKVDQQPAIENKTSVTVTTERTRINGIKAIRAIEGDSPSTIARRGKVDVDDFVKWNEMSRNNSIQPGEYYLLGKKRTRGDEAYHQVTEGESLWDVSQKHGVKLKRLLRYNRMRPSDDVKVGTTIWLASKKPRNVNDEIRNDVFEVDKTASFAWSAAPQEEAPASNTEITATPNPETVVSTPQAQVNPVDSAQNSVDSSQTLQTQFNVQPPPDSVATSDELIGAGTIIQKEHFVQSKETLYGIAQMYNVGVMELVEWNNLRIQDGIRPGQILKVSVSQPVESQLISKKTIEHEVRNSDTLYSIARKYGVTIKELMEWNNKKDFNLAIGERLKIQGK